MTTAQLNNCERLWILMWKNWFCHWNRRGRLILIVIMPIIFSSLLIFLRLKINAQHSPELRYKAIKITDTWQDFIKLMNSRIDRNADNDIR